MSHFLAVVIGEDVEGQLAPYHEFECTGDDNEYVQVVDRTDQARAQFAKATVRKVRLADGTIRELYDDSGNYAEEWLREPTAAEASKRNDIFASEPDRTWWDGSRSKVVHLPDGAKEIELPAKDYATFAAWAAEEMECPIIPHGMAPNTADDAQYGYVQLGPSMDENGDDVRVIRRTNPNHKWDWWQVGGRWTGFFRLKPRAEGALGEPGIQRLDPDYEGVSAGRADVARHGDIDWDGMRAAAEFDAGAR